MTPEAPGLGVRALVDAIQGGLRARGWTLAVAESCTGGLLLKGLTDRPGSSEVIVGGVGAYADRVKREILGVDPELLRREGAVSEGVARAMAAGVARALQTELGVAVTGIAGPGGGTPTKPVGTVWFGIWFEGKGRAESAHFPGDRETVREAAAEHALHLLLDAVGGGSPSA